MREPASVVVAEEVIEGIVVDESDPDRLIIALEKNNENGQWKAAELITAQLDKGRSQRELAKAIGKSRQHVQHMAAVWHLFSTGSLGTGHLGGHPDFNEAYQLAKKGGKKAIEGGEKPKREMSKAMLMGQMRSLLERIAALDDFTAADQEELQELVGKLA